ncbi:MAG TPA: L,D-transpeptidase family protein [Acidimicrobiales bacterium]|nr:L,D-transpeptidase family protein [Acidimicrobiales bacterium]
MGLAAVAVLGVGVGVAAFALRAPGSRAVASPPSTAAGAVAAATDPGPLSVVSVTPADGTTQIPSDATLSVRLSAPISPHSPTPSLSPAVAGSWQVVTPDTFTFVASAPLVPLATETISIPGGEGGLVSVAGRKLDRPSSVRFTVADGSTLRLQQLLAQLGYLPVSFTPAGPLAASQEAAQAQEGSFSWRWSEPASLEGQWTVGSANQITKGAVMAFESQHNMKTDGQAGPTVWEQLLADAAAGTMDPAPYNYVYVSKAIPETATVYSNGAEVYSTRANTGVAAAPTDSGTFPVYVRYQVTTMSGTNPDGSKYSDPGIPWVSYFNGGDALHGFVRSSYGTPQSVGCVEMPPANAAVVYPLTPIGTLVTVS